MQPIQDKDFDKLFKDAFEDAEITPSRNLWSNIEKEIEPKKTRIFPIYWLSAAAVLLIATFGYLVYQQQDVKPKQYANNVKPKTEQPVVVAQANKDSVVVNPIEKVEELLPVSKKPFTNLAKSRINEEVKSPEKQRIFTAPEMQKQESFISKVVEPEKDIKTKIDEAILQPKDETVLAAHVNEIKTDEVAEANSQVENKSIRNVGDVVNLIMNKVDKRKDKLIQFRTDDDDSSISSINIGPFKIGKRNKK